MDAAAELKRLRAKLDGPNPCTTPLIVPAWTGPSDLAGDQVSVTLREGRALVKISDSFRKNARKSDMILISEAFRDIADKMP